MKVKYVGNSDPIYFVNGKVYEVLGMEEEGLYRIIDETGEDYLYCIDDNFEIVSYRESLG